MEFEQADAFVHHVQARFGVRLRELRLARGLTQEALADLAQINWLEVSRYERGQVKNPSLDRLCRLAFALKVDFDEMLLNPDYQTN